MSALDEADRLRRNREWAAAYDAYAALEERTAPGVEGLAEAAWWLGRMDESISAYTEAFRLYSDGGQPEQAAHTAVLLSIHTRLTGESVLSAGWDGRAQRILADLPECAEHGYPLYLGTAGLTGSDLDAAYASSQRLQHLGRTYDDPALSALGVYFEGRIRIKQARVAEGLALLDEAMLAALSDELGPLWTGAIYCGMMDACNELRDLRRASEWTEATRRWSDPLPIASVYPGICRVHRAQVLQSRGAWDEAEQEALDTCAAMVGIDVFVVADAYYEVAEVRRLRGDCDGAEQAYRQAHDHGRDPQPGAALLQLRQGRGDDALVAINAAIAASGGSRLDRAALYAAQSEIALAVGDLDLAESAARTLESTAAEFESTGLAADGHRCVGAVLIERGQVMEALSSLRLALNAWNELDVPWEAARTRMLLARAYEACGDLDAAAREEGAARAAFDRLGVLPPGGDEAPAGLTPREVEVIRLLASGKSNRDIAADLFLSPKTVARHLSNIFAKTGSSTRTAAAAWAYDHGLMGRSTHA